jgi:putative hydrolase of the HAD superfamily
VNRAPVRALFFDVGGTLIQPWPSVGATYAAVARRHGLACTPEQMERAFRESWVALKRPGLTVSRKDWWRELVFRTLGQENEECFAELYNLFSQAESWRVFPDVEETLRDARTQGLHLGIISNWDERLRPLLNDLGLESHFDSITISCEVGEEKPAAAIFRAALDASGIPAAETVHIGDSLEDDVRGAVATGMRGVLVQRSNFAPMPAQTVVSDLRSVLKNF